jgi:hypothetical protein
METCESLSLPAFDLLEVYREQLMTDGLVGDSHLLFDARIRDQRWALPGAGVTEYFENVLTLVRTLG